MNYLFGVFTLYLLKIFNMTYEEALEFKQISERNTIMETGYEYVFLIVPSLTEDFIRFMDDYNEEEYTDENSKNYSSNNEYKLHHKMTEQSIRKFIFHNKL